MDLTKSTDQELAAQVRETACDEGALKELIFRHSGIFMDMLKAYGGKSFNQNQLNDFIDQKDSVIYEAAQKYDPERSKFSTFLANTTKYLCLSEKTKFQKHSIMTSLEETEFCQSDNSPTPDEDCLQNESMEKIKDMITNYHDKRVQQIFKMRYFETNNNKLTPWKKIAKTLDLSAQSCINIHDKTLKIFQNRVKNEQTIEF
jgi:RNA polymerase sigma factor (sigma-70 family)